MSMPQVQIADCGARVRVWPHCTDPAIKLFGRDIPVSALPNQNMLPQQQDGRNEVLFSMTFEDNMELVPNEVPNTLTINSGSEELAPNIDHEGIEGIGGQMSTPVSAGTSLVKGEEAPAHGKILKKPDKLLPCPRCESLDTKFCYFNNYNVNQPRHFCRKCQRYWTAGGMLRNVPVGAGRRKNKHSLSHHKNMAVASETITVRSDPSDLARHRCTINNSSPGGSESNRPKLGYSEQRLQLHPLEACTAQSLDSPSTKNSMPSFGQESPLCKSMAAASLGMHKPKDLQGNQRFLGQNSEEVIESKGLPIQGNISNSIGRNNDSTTLAGQGSNSIPIVCKQEQHKATAVSDVNVLHANDSSIPYAGGPWQFTGNMPWNSETPFPPPNLVPCNGTLGAPPTLWPTFPWALMNPAMWGAAPLGWASSWAMPWGPASAGLAGAVQTNQPDNSQPQSSLLVPKTLRIADPVDAARSSIWTALGLADGPPTSSNGAAKAFQIKSDGSLADDDSTAAKWHPNPAALSRSAAFNENS